MGLTSPIEQFYFKTINGMNNKVEDLELGDKAVSLAQNCRFEAEPGACSKRTPVSYYNNSSIGVGAIVGLYRYYTKGGTIKSIAAHGNQIYVGDDSAGTWTSIRTLGTSGYRPAFVTYNDLLIGSNGQDNPWVYDGSSDNITWELGSCKAKATTAAGSITKTSISYAITMDTDAYVCGAVSNEISTVTSKDINLTNIPLGPTGTTNRKIYRKDSSTSSTYKLVTTLANNSATTYTDNTADVSGNAAMPSVTDDMPTGDILLLHRERLFISGNSTNPNRIYYSNPYLPGFMQQSTNLDYMDVAKDDGDEITGLNIQQGVMICIKRQTIRKLYVAAASSGADPASWYSQDPDVFTGCPAQWSIVQTPFGIIFLGWDNWYIYDGSNIKGIIPQFDTTEILPARYNNVIVHWSKNLLYAAYTDRVAARQYNDRVMVYNFTRDAWGFDTLNVNAFSSHTGDSETGDLFFGDSINGYVYKAEESDYWYRLSNKTQCNNGTKSTVFVGGTESEPYVEIGSATSATAIPDDICIFWDDEVNTPGAGWTEVSSAGKFVYISTTAGTVAGSSAHTHTMSGTLATTTTVMTNCGDGSTGTDNTSHDHTFSGTSDSMSPVPTYVSYRIFKKNNTTTEYVFPEGAIVMWDQTTAPDGWLIDETLVGGYIRIGTTGVVSQVSVNSGGTGYAVGDILTISGGNGDCTLTVTSVSGGAVVDGNITTAGTGYSVTTNVAVTGGSGTYCYMNIVSISSFGVKITSNHNHTFSITSSADVDGAIDGGGGSSGKPRQGHTHTLAGATNSNDGSAWELDRVEFVFIKKVGEESTWDGTSKYVYTLYASAGTPTGWTDVSSTYTGKYLKIGTSLTTGTVSGAAHMHILENGISEGINEEVSPGGYHHQSLDDHTHNYSGTVASGTSANPAYLSFRLFKKILAQMLDYNSALTSDTPYGIWTSPSLQLNPTTLKNIFWNSTKGVSDTITFFMRTGATQAVVENGTACTPDHTTDVFNATSHGMSNGDRIVISASALPTDIVDTIVYYIVNKHADDFQVALTAGGTAVTFSSNGTTVTWKKWTGAYTASSSVITNTPAIWIQYLIAFTADDTTVINPKVYMADGFMVKFNYTKLGTIAETSVEWIYDIGWRNFDTPMVDKILKKIISYHVGANGSFKVYWDTENASGEFEVALGSYPERWNTFFQSTATGKILRLQFYKNDLFDFTLKEIQGAYSSEPILI